jgi:hypothetical protein
MCQFEDVDIVSRYTRDQAVEDGALVELLRWNGRPVMVTTHLRDEMSLSELLVIWKEFKHWRKFDKPALPEEDHLFHTGMNGKSVWVIEDGEAYTLMYPEDY